MPERAGSPARREALIALTPVPVPFDARLQRLAEARRDGALLWPGASVLRGLPWVLRERRVIADHVEMSLQKRDAFDATPLGVWQRRFARDRADSAGRARAVDHAEDAPEAALVAVQETPPR